jgi:cell division protein FtsW
MSVTLSRPRLDGLLLALIAVIVLAGLIMVGSASITMAARDNGEPFAYLERQLVLVAGGTLLAVIAFMIPIERLQKLALPLLIAAGVMLLLVFVPGLAPSVKGSHRWLKFAGLNFQVSELARVFVLIYMADYCTRFEKELRTSGAAFARGLGLLCLVAGLLVCEPDLGAATVLMATGFGLMFLAGAQLRWVAAAMAVGAMAFAALIFGSGYRLRRLQTFLDPWADPLGDGFQLTQSLIAIGRGEWFGVGLGASVQKLFYLPEAHNDFLFAVLAEELGLIGVLITIALFLLLAWRVLLLVRRAQSAGMKFHAYLAAGFALWIGVQAFVNMGVNMGVLPTKGLTLPLMSYGRSSLIVTLCWIGIIMRVHHEVSNGPRASARERYA